MGIRHACSEGAYTHRLLLSLAFKKPDFRGRQREIMEAAVRGADVLVVAPTGMGKRYAFQVICHW